jgi:hypothetical protein
MLTARFEPVIPVSERPQTHALDGAAAGISHNRIQTTLSVLKQRKLIVWMVAMMASETSYPCLTSHYSSAALAYIYHPKNPIAG